MMARGTWPMKIRRIVSEPVEAQDEMKLAA